MLDIEPFLLAVILGLLGFSYWLLRYRRQVIRLRKLVSRQAVSPGMADKASAGELESVYEELATTSEELIATNDELISTNEELAATNEELAATNEEMENAYGQLNSTVEQLRGSEDRFRALFQHAAIPTVVMTPDLIIREVNRAYCQLLGRSELQLQGSSVVEFTYQDDAQASIDAAEKLRAEPLSVHTYLKRFVHSGDTPVWVMANSTGIINANGQLESIVAQVQDVSKQLLAEEQRDRLFNHSMDMLCIATFAGRFEQVNPAFTRILGYSEEEVMATPWLDLVHPDDREATIEAGSSLAEGKPLRGFENRYVCKDGSIRWLSWNSYPLPEEQRIFGVARDVTELKRQQSYINRFFNLRTGLLLVVDLDGKIIRANPAWEDLLEIPLDELIGRRIIDFVHPEDLERTMRQLEGLGRGKEVFRFENRYVSTSGKTHQLAWSASSIPADGLVFAHAHDITVQKRALEKTKVSESRLSRALSGTGLAIWEWDIKANRMWYGEGWQELLGYSEEELASNMVDAQQRNHPDDSQAVAAAMEKCINGEARTLDIQFRALAKDGTYKWLHSQATLEYDFNQQPRRLVGTVKNITGEKEAEASLRRLGAAISQAAEAIVVTDSEGTIQFVNPAFCEITGYSEQEAIGNNPRILKSGKHDDRFYKEMWDTLTAGQVWHGELTNKRKDGGLYNEQATISPILDDRGQISNYVAIKRDVTRQLMLERQVRQAQKMEAIGTLAGGIAHDFNNILFAMLGYADMALEDTDPDTTTAHSLREVLNAGMRAKELIHQILSFARQGEQQLAPLNISPIVKEVIKLLKASLPSTIEISYTELDKYAVVMGDATQVHQVIMNLCTNAGHAMRDSGGQLAISLAEICTVEVAALGLPLPAGSYSVLAVRDTGPGIPADIQPRIFEPFFTTKKKDEGTGMGLSVVHGVVTEMGGAVTLDSTPGEGAEFRVYLPKVEQQVDALAARDQELPGGSEHILLVDDEESLVTMLREILSSLGYSVSSFSSSSEALAAFMEQPDSYELLFTDQTMPKVTGVELARQLHKARPGLPVVLCTGYSRTSLPENLEEAGISELLLKPINRATLAHALRRALDTRNAPAGQQATVGRLSGNGHTPA